MEPPPTAEPSLSELATPWAANPAYADLELPFRMGVTARPCDATYTVQGYERLFLTYSYEPRRVVVESEVGEMAGQGHRFCLPNPPLVAFQELTPLRMTLDLDERGRVIGQTVVDLGTDPPRQLSESGAQVAFELDGEHRVVERRVTAQDGELQITSYVYEVHEPRLVSTQWSRYIDPGGEPTSQRSATFTYEADRLVGCTLSSEPEESMTIRYGYDDQGRLVSRSALVIDTYEGETNEQEAWAWSYRYDCSAPRETPEDEYH